MTQADGSSMLLDLSTQSLNTTCLVWLHWGCWRKNLLYFLQFTSCWWEVRSLFDPQFPIHFSMVSPHISHFPHQCAWRSKAIHILFVSAHNQSHSPDQWWICLQWSSTQSWGCCSAQWSLGQADCLQTWAVYSLPICLSHGYLWHSVWWYVCWVPTCPHKKL